MDEVLQCAQEPKNEREMVLVFHQNGRSIASARLIAPGSRLVGFGPSNESKAAMQAPSHLWTHPLLARRVGYACVEGKPSATLTTGKVLQATTAVAKNPHAAGPFASEQRFLACETWEWSASPTAGTVALPICPHPQAFSGQKS